ncbi:MAG: malonate decarboxylase holo-[acyl-carrier-protein] synthase [Pseudomonadota bacterium]
MTSRHELAWLTAQGWHAAQAAAPGHAHVLERWRREDWPAVVRRHDADADPINQVCLGIALPPDDNGVKLRIALRAQLTDVARRVPPLDLTAVRHALPDAWQAGFAQLEGLAAGFDLRVYGSLSWQALTGLPCVTPASDIDLLFQPSGARQLRAGLAVLGGAGHGLPLDGEIMFPSGQAVAWKEWLVAEAADARVLVKSGKGVRLAARHELLATLGDSP